MEWSEAVVLFIVNDWLLPIYKYLFICAQNIIHREHYSQRTLKIGFGNFCITHSFPFREQFSLHYDKYKYMVNVARSVFHIGSHSRLKILDYKLPSLSNLRCFLNLSPSLALMFLHPNRTKSHVSAFLKCDGNIELHVSATLTFRGHVLF